LDLPPTIVDNKPLVQPLAIVGWKTDDTIAKTSVLVQWSGLLPEDSSWEDLEELKKEYPGLDLEDKVLFDGVGDVMDYDAGPNDPIEAEMDLGHELDYEAEDPPLRPKRKTNKPLWLKDYKSK
jgi:hypothetical protein